MSLQITFDRFKLGLIAGAPTQIADDKMFDFFIGRIFQFTS
jgi:hypothetical protein